MEVAITSVEVEALATIVTGGLFCSAIWSICDLVSKKRAPANKAGTRSRIKNSLSSERVRRSVNMVRSFRSELERKCVGTDRVRFKPDVLLTKVLLRRSSFTKVTKVLSRRTQFGFQAGLCICTVAYETIGTRPRL